MTPNAKAPSDADIAIGRRIRDARHRAGVSQDRLARTLGVTFQQVQKYENGVNRVASGRLATIASALGTTPVSLLGPGAAAPALSPDALRIATAFDRLPPGSRRDAIRCGLELIGECAEIA